MARILVVEDDAAIVSTLTNLLHCEGYEVESTDQQDTAIALLGQNAYDLALIDISLAQGNGFAVCAAAKNGGSSAGTAHAAHAAHAAAPDIRTATGRSASASTSTSSTGTRGVGTCGGGTCGVNAVSSDSRLVRSPAVIFLTASDDEFSTVAGLDMGADDYIAKPFRARELLSRIRSTLRRTSGASPLLTLGNVEVDSTAATVRKNGVEVALSALEYRLLLLFAQNIGKLVTREHVRNAIWDSAGEYVSDNTLNVYIKRLRDKIEDDPSQPQLIQTIRGLGYKAGA